MATHERDEIAGWFAGRLPDGWFTGAPSVTIDEGQIVVVGTLTEPTLPADASAQLKTGAEAGRISRFREATRPYRIHIAREAEHRFELDVTWGVTCGGTTETFTPGGSGRHREKGEGGGEEAKKVMIAARRAAMRRWGRRFAFGGPRAWRRGRGWYAWQGDEQSF
ncbi:MAG TPA: hypothetical protein VIC57_18810 [Candidatus Dormibacteraeota bacterium]|jgi:hypothetical protein